MSEWSNWMTEGEDPEQPPEDTPLRRDDKGEPRGHGESTETRGP